MLRLTILLAGLVAASSVAAAQSESPPNAAPVTPALGDTIRLSDQERQAIVDATTADSAAAARGEMVGAEREKLAVHGQVSAFVGSRGARGIAGTAAVPLGEHAGAVVSFESEQFGRRR